MNYSRYFLIVIESFCVAILSLCGISSFSNSSLYPGFERIAARLMPSNYISLIIFLALLVGGLFFVIVRNRGGGGLTIFAIILSLPSILSYNNIDLLKIFGGSSQITTQMTLPQMISIGSLIITAYFLLDFISQLRTNIIRLKSQQSLPSDLQLVVHQQHLASIILAGGALFISLILTGVARGFEYFISRNAFALSWWIVPGALFCIFSLGFYLYWVTTRKNE